MNLLSTFGYDRRRRSGLYVAISKYRTFLSSFLNIKISLLKALQLISYDSA